MKKRYLLITLVLVLALLVSACSKPATDENKPTDNGNVETNVPDEGKEGEEGEEGKVDAIPYEQIDLKVGFVTDEGGVNDQSFNQSALEGLQQAAKDFGITVEYQESHNTSDYAPNLETILDQGNELIWAAGYKLGDAVYDAAKANEDTNYAILDYAYGDNSLPNLLGILFKAEQPSFLVGYISGVMTETNKVGFIGGITGNIIDGFDYGYQAGVQYAAKQRGVEIDVLSQYVGDFSDTTKAKAIANNMYSQDRDIVFHAAGGAGDGLIEAAKENGKWAIGVDRDQNYMAPEVVLTSAMKRVDVAIWNVIKDLSEGKPFPGGETVIYGLESGAVGIAPTSDKNVPADVLAQVDEISKLIIDGTIQVPYNAETFEAYMQELNK